MLQQYSIFALQFRNKNQEMKQIGKRNSAADLSVHGFNAITAYWNLTPEELIEHTIKKEMGVLADSGALAVNTGDFTGSFDSLVRFVDTAQFAITQRRDTSYADVEKNKAYGLDPQTGGYILEEIITDTLSYTSVKDSLYGGTDRYKNMMNIPVAGVDDKIELKAGKLVKNDVTYSVFEAKVAKTKILSDLDKDLLAQELQVISVDGVNGEFITVGSLDEINTSGNWPKNLEAAKKQ